MRLFRTLPLMVAAVLFLVSLARPAQAQGVRIRTYGSGVVGGNIFGTGFGAAPFGAGTFGAFGATPFGFTPSGVMTYGAVPLAVDASNLTATTFTFMPSAVPVAPFTAPAVSTRAFFHGRTQFFTPPTVLVPVARPGTNLPGTTVTGSEVMNEIKQIKEKITSIENDVKGLKDRVDKIKPVVVVQNQELLAEKIKQEREAVHKKWQKYFEDVKEYQTKLQELFDKKEKAALEAAAAPKDQAKQKAAKDAADAYKALKPPTQPTLDN